MKTIRTAMCAYHDKLERLGEKFIASVVKNNRRQDCFLEYAAELGKHFSFEERQLFPLVHKYLGIKPDCGPMLVIYRDHKEINKLLAIIKKLMNANRPKKTLFYSFHLKQALHSHRQREDKIQYHLADKLIPASEREKVQKIIFDLTEEISLLSR